MAKEKLEKLAAALRERPLVPLLLLALALLLLLPDSGGEAGSAAETETEISAPQFSVAREEERLREILESAAGVGEAKVLLAVSSTAQRELASSNGEAIVVSAGSGKQEAVERGYSYPEYLGAVVVCTGAGNASVRLRVVEAVSAFTGLGAAEIRVLEMK